MPIDSTKRVACFFVKTIYMLKEESGSQRWNEICENTSQLFLHLWAQANYEKKKYNQEDIWKVFFEPLQSTEQIEEFCQTIEGQSILFCCLQGLTDPPSSWWESQMR